MSPFRLGSGLNIQCVSIVQTLVSVYLCFLAIRAPPMSPEIPTATPSSPITTPTIIPVDEPVLSELQLPVGKEEEFFYA